jgi:hypothetical protein
VNNIVLSNVQKFHYLIASLKNEAKALISNLQITNEKLLVAWQLETQLYNKKRIIAVTHGKHLCQMPQVKKGDASSLRQLINHVSSHMNALQVIYLNVPVQDLMLIHLILATLEADTLGDWETHTARQVIPLFKELVTFLENKCKAFEVLQNVQESKTFVPPSTSTTVSWRQGQ